MITLNRKQNKTKPPLVPEKDVDFVNGVFEHFLWSEGCVDGVPPACPSQRQSLLFPRGCFRVIRVGL